MEILINDRNGNPIKEGDLFKFKYLNTLHKYIDLKGQFYWNQIELRYEIDIIDDDTYVCLSYLPNSVMIDFELI